MRDTHLKRSFLSRFWEYQNERFPILNHGLIIMAFTYAAISYSIISRGGDRFIPVSYFIVGILTTLCLFFGMRVLDEIKDKDKDAKYRIELPVPRGLISIPELSGVALIFAILVLLAISIVYAKMLIPLVVVLVYLGFMTFEFFIPEKLNKNLFLYASSHMLIIPFIDIYASGLDWYMKGLSPHVGLIIFFVVSFFNGLTLEIGRKIKAPQDEATGVDTYSSLFGVRKSLMIWILMLTITYVASIIAIHHADLGLLSMITLSLVYIISIVVGMDFYDDQSSSKSKWIEYTSGIWTFSMYIVLGNIPGQLLNQFI